MIKQILDKIRKLLKNKVYSVPEILMKFYAMALVFAKSIEDKEAQSNTITLYSDLYNLFKKYLADEPFQLSKITADQLAAGQDSQPLTETIKLRDAFLKNWANSKPKNQQGQLTIQQMRNLKWAGKLKPVYINSFQIKSQLDIKRKSGSLPYNELAIACWYSQFKSEYIIHIDQFVDYVLPFIKEYFLPLKQLGEKSKPTIAELCDPQQKCYVTVANCDQFLLRIRQPSIQQRLLTQDIGKLKYSNQYNLKLLMQGPQLKQGQILLVSGEKVIVGSEKKIVRHSPAVMVGSAADSDIFVNSKYISRKQLLIIEDTNLQKDIDWQKQEAENSHFSLVCVSQTNFTPVKFPIAIKAQPGMIFYSEDVKYQIVQLCRQTNEPEPVEEQAQEEEDDQRTLTLLPQDRQSSRAQNANSQKVGFLILSGEDKQTQITLTSQAFLNITQISGKHLKNLKKVLTCEPSFMIQAKTKVLAKTANQVLENKLSRKIRLLRGMEICLEEFSLIVC